MGGLRRLMPITFMTYAIGMMALSGVPLLFAGAWTKEEVLHATAHWPKSQVPYYLMLAGVVLTALYMTRQMIYVFYNKRRGAEAAHESPPVMTRPLIVLALCTIGLSAVLTSAWPWLHSYLSGEAAHLDFGQCTAACKISSFVQPPEKKSGTPLSAIIPTAYVTNVTGMSRRRPPILRISCS